jgi:1,4-dihydroxy-2-naphthoyl-CoA hydrolase
MDSPADDGLVDAGRLASRIGLEFVELSPERVVARIPVEGNTQPYGILHGGATASLCETVGSVGTALRAGPDKVVMGIHLSVNHLRTVRSGHVTATGTPVHLGRSTSVWDMRVLDDDGRLVAVSRLTLAVRSRDGSPDTPGMPESTAGAEPGGSA